MIYFTADWHLSHNNKHGGIIKYCNRPFSSIEEMDDTIWKNFFSTVKNGDTVYFLGDLTFRKDLAEDFFDKTKGIQIHFIFGNHDHKINSIIKRRATWYGDMKYISPNGKPIVITHYAMRVWHKSHFNSWNLHGHSHGGLSPEGKQWDVGVDNNNFYPVSINDIIGIMDKQPDNFNLVDRSDGNR